MRLSKLCLLLYIAASCLVGMGHSLSIAQDDPLTAEERAAAVASLRKYAALFADHRVDCEMHGPFDNGDKQTPFELTISVSDKATYWSTKKPLPIADPFGAGGIGQQLEQAVSTSIMISTPVRALKR
jgi:hypothetical protein